MAFATPESVRTEKGQTPEALEFAIIVESLNVCTRRDPALDRFALRLIISQASETALTINIRELAVW